MLTRIFPDNHLYTRLLLVTALSGMLITSVMAQGRGNKPSDRNVSDGASITHKVETTGRQDNRRESVSGTDRGTRSTTNNTVQSANDSSYRQNSRLSGTSVGPSEKIVPRQSYQSDRGNIKTADRPIIYNRKPVLSSTDSDSRQNNSGMRDYSPADATRQQIDTRNRGNSNDPGIGNRKPQLPSNSSDSWQNNTDNGSRGPVFGNNQQFDTRNRGYRAATSADNRKPERPASRSYFWNGNSDRGNNGSSVTHNVTVDNRNRDYRDRVPAYSQDSGRNNNRFRDHRPPTFRDGRYYYSSRPNYQPSLFGYWAFNDDPGYRRSLYFYYGYFPYMDTVRIHIGPYVDVGYYGRPVVFGDDSDYYLASRANSELDYTLSDIRKSWLDGRTDLIDNHVRDDQSIAVLLDGKYDYTIEANDYIQMTSDAIDQTQTVSFTWENVRKRTDGKYTAFGKHTYKNPEGDTKIVYVSYTLGRSGSDYFITEVGSSNRPLE